MSVEPAMKRVAIIALTYVACCLRYGAGRLGAPVIPEGR